MLFPMHNIIYIKSWMLCIPCAFLMKFARANQRMPRAPDSNRSFSKERKGPACQGGLDTAFPRLYAP